MPSESETAGGGIVLMPQTDRELAEMIAQFRTPPPRFNWAPLANDIETAFKSRRELWVSEMNNKSNASNPAAIADWILAFADWLPRALTSDEAQIDNAFRAGYSAAMRKDVTDGS